ncbi:MAG: hypothetical protein ACI3U1_02040 [Peptococcaceae bacterium]
MDGEQKQKNPTWQFSAGWIFLSFSADIIAQNGEKFKSGNQSGVAV